MAELMSIITIIMYPYMSWALTCMILIIGCAATQPPGLPSHLFSRQHCAMSSTLSYMTINDDAKVG